MTSALHLHVTHIQGAQCNKSLVHTFQRDDLLDNAALETLLAPHAFQWLVSARCMIRKGLLGQCTAWWLQHGSRHILCSINDQIVACGNAVMLHTGDIIEIGLVRLQVLDQVPSSGQPTQIPALPVSKPHLPPPLLSVQGPSPIVKGQDPLSWIVVDAEHTFSDEDLLMDTLNIEHAIAQLSGVPAKKRQ
jgi:hypothetical protein